MSESLRKAVEGFERDRNAQPPKWSTELATFDLDAIERGLRSKLDAKHRFRRADVHDCITAANEQRQLAIASPKSAEQANALATRLSDLAERIAALLEEE